MTAFSFGCGCAKVSLPDPCKRLAFYLQALGPWAYRYGMAVCRQMHGHARFRPPQGVNVLLAIIEPVQNFDAVQIIPINEVG